jgi:hypothetical protein
MGIRESLGRVFALGARSKRAQNVRTGGEFDISRLSLPLTPPRTAPSVYSWSLEEIKNARDDQMRGNFKRAARLAESMRTDDALFVAKTNRLAPQKCLEVALAPTKGARGEPVAKEADALFGASGVALSAETRADVHSCLVDHHVAFARATQIPREDGDRVDVSASYWPIEFVRWDSFRQSYVTQVEGGGEEVITHGDGRWIVWQMHGWEPFKSATLLPGSLVWARHAFGVRDWSKGSVAHGNAKVIGEMPVGVALQDEAGAVTPEASAFLELLRAIASADSPVGIRPAGSKTDYLVNGSQAWQIFQHLVDNAEKAAARIYLGTDGTLGAQGGAPGVDIQALFGVAATIVEGDLECLERGIKTGLIEPWCAINFGDSTLAPTFRYKRPDPDEQARRLAVAERRAKFFEAYAAARENGFEVDQAFVDKLAASLGIEAPAIKPKPTASGPTAPLVSAPQLRAAGR